MADAPFHVGQVLTGPLFNEPMRVVTAAAQGDGAWTLGLVGERAQMYASAEALKSGACLQSLDAQVPQRPGFFHVRAVDGFGHTVNKKMFVIQLHDSAGPVLWGRGVLGNLVPASIPEPLPSVVGAPEATAFLHKHAAQPFIETVRNERPAEVARIAEHVGLSLTEPLQRADEEIGKANEDKERGVAGADGSLAQAENRHSELLARRDRRRKELEQQRSLTLQAVERMASVLVLPHPDREAPEVRSLRPNLETEATAMRVVIECEKGQGRQVYDVHEKNLGYDVTSLDINSGELRLIEVKGLAEATRTILLTPNERRVAEDRRGCYWLYVVTNCAATPTLQEPIKDPARFPWHEVTKVAHYWLEVGTMTRPMPAPEGFSPYRALPKEAEDR